MEAKTGIRVRDPGSAVTADDLEHRLPYQTKRRTRPTRGPRSLHAALSETRLDSSDENRLCWERFSGTTWTSVFLPATSNKKTHPAEEFFRFSAFRYVVDEARRNAQVGLRELAEVLLGGADAVHRLNRYYYDVPGEELPSLYRCSEAAVAAYNSGWLPYLSADWMVDDGAEAVLHLINLRSCSSRAESTAARIEAFGFGKLEPQVEVRVSRARDARLKIGRYAKGALKELRIVCPALDSSLAAWPIAVSAKASPDPAQCDRAAEPAARALMKLYTLLRQPSRSVLWDVNARAGSFLRELRELSEALKNAVSPPMLQERMVALGWTLVSMQTGISMPELARELGGGNFFQRIEGATDSDLEEEAAEIAALPDGEAAGPSLEEWERRCLVALEFQQSESESSQDLDLWVSAAPTLGPI